ncbi:MAG: aminoacyltransferase [Prevotellaceae bacterium]|nr:aminoacyltransferase [Prevotellaceae bacterium]
MNFQIQTTSVEKTLLQISTTKRRDIRISEKNGAKIVEISNKQNVRDYYNLLNELYLTKIKTPLFPFEFFEQLTQLPECKIFGVKYQEQIIGGSVCILYKNNVVYEWFACGLDRKFKNIYPSTLATWAGIQYAAANNYKYFDMMGAGKPNEEYGVRDFKVKFGGDLVEHGRFLYITQPLLYKLGKKIIQIIKNRK